MRRRARPPVAGVSWRDGVHVVGTSVWCDARRARAVCFVSSADRTGRGGHGQLIATAETLALLAARPDAHLAAPLGRPFTLGTTRLELVASGHAVGAAALAVDTGSHRVLYAGAVDPVGGGLGGVAALRPCDTLVVAAPYGAERHAFAAGARDAALAFVAETAASGAVPVVLVTSVLKALDVAARLAAAGIEVAGHRTMVQGARRLTAAGVTVAIQRGVAPGRALLWPVDDRGRVDAVVGRLPARVALVSGLATEPDLVEALAVDAAFAWSNAADREQLLAFVAASGAAEVAVTGPYAEDVVASVGARARALGPPRQMPLFAAVP